MWITREWVGIYCGDWMWKTVYIIKRKETEVPEGGFEAERRGFEN